MSDRDGESMQPSVVDIAVHRLRAPTQCGECNFMENGPCAPWREGVKPICTMIRRPECDENIPFAAQLPVTRAGLEPATYGLKVRCSTS